MVRNGEKKTSRNLSGERKRFPLCPNGADNECDELCSFSEKCKSSRTCLKRNGPELGVTVTLNRPQFRTQKTTGKWILSPIRVLLLFYSWVLSILLCKHLFNSQITQGGGSFRSTSATMCCLRLSTFLLSMVSIVTQTLERR